MEFYVMTKSGSEAPSFVHNSRESAITEAKRLQAQFDEPVKVLQVVAVVVVEEVPITKKEQRVLFAYDNDDLPF